jgi:hypothetical protein
MGHLAWDKVLSFYMQLMENDLRALIVPFAMESLLSAKFKLKMYGPPTSIMLGTMICNFLFTSFVMIEFTFFP